MSQEDEEAVRRAIELLNRGDLEAALDVFHPDVVLDYSRSPFPEARVYNGREGAREWMRGFTDAFAGLHWEVEEIINLGPDKVLAIYRVRGQGRFSEIEMDYTFAALWTARDGKVIRMDRYDTRAEALEALGLRE